MKRVIILACRRVQQDRSTLEDILLDFGNDTRIKKDDDLRRCIKILENLISMAEATFIINNIKQFTRQCISANLGMVKFDLRV
jgi:hypothetical protein